MIKDDLSNYPCYLLRHRRLVKLTQPPSQWSNMLQAHHFIRQSVRKNSPEFYERVKHLQKIIFMPTPTHYNLHAMTDTTFFSKYGVNKNDLLFNRKKWREGYYEEVK